MKFDEQTQSVITNCGVLPHSELNTLLTNSDRSVYEVIRVIDGIALFLEDHFARLVYSVQISGFSFEMNFSDFRQNIAELGRINQLENGNVKFVLTQTSASHQWSFSFIPHQYPVSSDYVEGVRLGLLFAERQNPNAKIIQQNVRDEANILMKENEFYEVLLVNREGLITEGSRSNVFFVREDRFYTAPASQVLMGVTRQKVLECISELKFLVVEEAISTSEINEFEAVFLTGTSPKILPVNSIVDHSFSVNNYFVSTLMVKYNRMIENYIRTQNT